MTRALRGDRWTDGDRWTFWTCSKDSTDDTKTYRLFFCSVYRIASSNNTSKSESDQEDNDDINDNDWSYGSEKKCEFLYLASHIRIW